jgi:hypothetical protein
MTTKVPEKKQEPKEIKSISPAEMMKIMNSGDRQIPIEQMQQALELQMKWEANEAKKAYHRAMSAFKENPPKITKDKSVRYKDVKYSHASLANVVQQITKELSKHGLSASWRTQQNGNVLVTCIITHVLGHSEETTISAPADSTGSKNSIQAIGSTITYLERYTLLAALGLATYDQDDDGIGAQTSQETIDEKQVATICDYITAYGVNTEKFLKYLGVEALEDVLKVNYQKAINAIKAKKKKT